jgi:hypothetical protein
MVNKLAVPPTPNEVIGKINEIIDEKQDTLVSGTNIKTINNQSVLGNGNITIGGAVDSVNGHTGTVVLTPSDLGITEYTAAEVETLWSSL